MEDDRDVVGCTSYDHFFALQYCFVVGNHYRRIIYIIPSFVRNDPKT